MSIDVYITDLPNPQETYHCRGAIKLFWHHLVHFISAVAQPQAKTASEALSSCHKRITSECKSAVRDALRSAAKRGEGRTIRKENRAECLKQPSNVLQMYAFHAIIFLLQAEVLFTLRSSSQSLRMDGWS